MPRHCKSIPHEQVQFRAILVATNPTRYHHLSRKVATCRDMSRLQYKKKSHTHWNCWNSVAVMFELRCSVLELDCSDVDMFQLLRRSGVGPARLANHVACGRHKQWSKTRLDRQRERNRIRAVTLIQQDTEQQTA